MSKYKIKAGGPMPLDVKDMLGLPVLEGRKKKKRSTSETRSVKPSPIAVVKRPAKVVQSKVKEQFVSPSLDERFDQQAKRNMISAYLNIHKESIPSQPLVPKTPTMKEKNKAVIDALKDKITPAQPPPDAEPGSPGPKLNLADVIIAAAAAKTVKLKGKGIHKNLF